MNELVDKLDTFPEFLSSADLVFIGLFPSVDSCYWARKTGMSPDFFKMKRKILYPKSSVIKFIEDRLHKGSSL